MCHSVTSKVLLVLHQKAARSMNSLLNLRRPSTRNNIYNNLYLDCLQSFSNVCTFAAKSSFIAETKFNQNIKIWCNTTRITSTPKTKKNEINKRRRKVLFGTLRTQKLPKVRHAFVISCH